MRDPVSSWSAVHLSPGAAAVPEVAGRLLRSLEERRTVDVARGLLVGLTGCTWRRAGLTLADAADRRVLPIAVLAAQLIDSLEATAGADTDDGAESFVAGLEDLARRPGGPEPGPSAEGPTPSGQRPGPAGQGPPGWPVAVMIASPIVAGDLRGVRVEGELDLATVPEFHAVAADLDRAGPRAGGVFLLDLAALTFLDVAGVSAFRGLDAAVTSRGHVLRVVGPVARSPRRLLGLAVDRQWLPASFDGRG